ncbi:two-component regulator propeller domain-containing protein [Acidobacteriota bacterium]
MIHTARTIWLLILSLSLSPYLTALDPEQPPDRFLTDEWRTSQGLPSDTINAIAQTKNGYLWIGTNKGLIRFDGVNFETIDFAPAMRGSKNRRVSTLYVDKDGVLWIGHPGGLTRFKGGNFLTFSSHEGLSGERISGIRGDSSGSLWVGTANNYLNRLDKGTITLFDASKGLPGKFITAILEDSHGSLWVGTLRDGLYLFQYGRFVPVKIEGLTQLHSLHVLFEDRQGFLWLGTNMGLFRVKDEDVRVYTTRDGLSDNRVNEILEDSDGSLWVGTVNGLNRIKKGNTDKFHIEYCFQNHYINCLFEDREKSIWVGTNGSALKRLREGVFRTYSTEESVANFVSSLYEKEDGTIWIGTDYGQLYSFKAGDIVELPVKKDILDLRIRALSEDLQDHVVVGTIRDGLFRIRDKNLESYPFREILSGSIIQTIFRDSQNHLWIGTMGKGLFRIQEDIIKHYTVGDGLLSNVILNVIEDNRNNIWVATSKGINLLPQRQFKQIKKYLEGIFTLTIYEDNTGTFWVGTLENGLFRFKGGKYNRFTTNEGLASNNIHQILEDQREYLWLSSDVGILKVNKKELEKFFNSEIDRVNCIVYGLSDGLKSVECSSWGRNSAVKSVRGEFWFATKKGVSVVNPAKLKTDTLPPPPVLIEKVVVNEKKIKTPRDKLNFKDDEDIEIYFTATTFIALERVKFRFKLEGVDKDWVFLNWERKRSAAYANLPVGTYTFFVTACSSDGAWNKEGAALTFSVTSGFSENHILLITLILLFLISVLLWTFRKKKIVPRLDKTKKYKTSTIDPDKAEEIVKKLTHLLEYEKVYRDEKISLQSLSKELSVTYHQLSQVINEKLGKNFFDLINGYRIREAKKRLVDPKEKTRSVLAIAYDVGFNTKAAFNRVFKKYTRMTPSQFRQKFRK